MTEQVQRILDELYEKGFKSDIERLAIENLEDNGGTRLVCKVRNDMLGSRRGHLKTVLSQ